MTPNDTCARRSCSRARPSPRSTAADALAHVLKELMTEIAMPASLHDFGYTPDDVDTLVAGTMKQTRQLAVVPRPVTPEALGSIYRDSF